jgi:hypothetical protein
MHPSFSAPTASIPGGWEGERKLPIKRNLNHEIYD